LLAVAAQDVEDRLSSSAFSSSHRLVAVWGSRVRRCSGASGARARGRSMLRPCRGSIALAVRAQISATDCARKTKSAKRTWMFCKSRLFSTNMDATPRGGSVLSSLNLSQTLRKSHAVSGLVGAVVGAARPPDGVTEDLFKPSPDDQLEILSGINHPIDGGLPDSGSDRWAVRPSTATNAEHATCHDVLIRSACRECPRHSDEESMRSRALARRPRT
jgi:hypothetical protein